VLCVSFFNLLKNSKSGRREAVCPEAETKLEGWKAAMILVLPEWNAFKTWR
jgi:hypothetical protein